MQDRGDERDLPPVALGLHSIGDFDEASDIGTSQQAGEDTLLSVLSRPLGASAQANLVALGHDILELLVDFLSRP